MAPVKKKKYTGKIIQAVGLEWTEILGELNWNHAMALGREFEIRLPTSAELKKAFNSFDAEDKKICDGVTLWTCENDCNDYLKSKIFFNGSADYIHIDSFFSVRYIICLSQKEESQERIIVPIKQEIEFKPQKEYSGKIIFAAGLEWTQDAGNMNWHEAMAMAKTYGIRLPTSIEFQKVFTSNSASVEFQKLFDADIIQNYCIDGLGRYYWTCEEDGSNAYYYFKNNSNCYFKNNLKYSSIGKILSTFKENNLINAHFVFAKKFEIKPKIIQAVGLEWTGKEWTRDFNAMNWYDAMEIAKIYGMRLPTRAEYKKAYNAGITKDWEKYNGNLVYWTSDESLTDEAYTFNPKYSEIHSYSKLLSRCFVRCIPILKKEEPKQIQEVCIDPKSTYTKKFIQAVGLEWTEDLGKMTWFYAIDLAEELGMRLPTKKELESLFGRVNWGKEIQVSYWSSSTYFFNSNKAWTASLNPYLDEMIYEDKILSNINVRFVR